LVIYQIGDNYDFHGGAIPWLDKLPGVVCLHDFFVAHLFNGWAQSNRQVAEEVLRLWYGDEVSNDGVDSVKGACGSDTQPMGGRAR
jgi:hypothetical protein